MPHRRALILNHERSIYFMKNLMKHLAAVLSILGEHAVRGNGIC